MKSNALALAFRIGSLGILAAPALYSQGPQAAAKPRPLLMAAPTLYTPVCGVELHNFPRTIHFTWGMVPHSDYYVVEVDCFDAHQVGHWDSEFGLSFKGGIAATALTYNGFPGDNKGRWRVRGVHRGTPTSPLVEGPWSKWCDFKFKTSPQPTPPKPSVKPTIKILRIACEDKLKVKILVSIDSPSGISQWQVWSTWGGSTHFDKVYPAPLPTHVEETVTLEHFNPDPVDRAHQWGLAVTVPGISTPFRVYEMEPGPQHRCPGHYVPQTSPNGPTPK